MANAVSRRVIITDKDANAVAVSSGGLQVSISDGTETAEVSANGALVTIPCCNYKVQTGNAYNASHYIDAVTDDSSILLRIAVGSTCT